MLHSFSILLRTYCVPELGLMFSIHYLTESCVTFLDVIIVILGFVVLSFHFDYIMILKMLKRLSILLTDMFIKE